MKIKEFFKKHLTKIAITVAAITAVFALAFTSCTTYAYTYDSETGNLMSDNLYNMEDYTYTASGGVTFEFANGEYHIYGTCTATFEHWQPITNFNIPSGKKCSVQMADFKDNLSSSTRYNFRIAYAKYNYQNVISVATGATTFNGNPYKTQDFGYSYNLPMTYVYFVFYAGDVIDYNFKPMVNLGEVEKYEPYGKQWILEGTEKTVVESPYTYDSETGNLTSNNIQCFTSREVSSTGWYIECEGSEISITGTFDADNNFWQYNSQGQFFTTKFPNRTGGYYFRMIGDGEYSNRTWYSIYRRNLSTGAMENLKGCSLGVTYHIDTSAEYEYMIAKITIGQGTWNGNLKMMVAYTDVVDTYVPYGTEWITTTNANNMVTDAKAQAITEISTQYEIFASGTPSTMSNISSITTTNVDGTISSYTRFYDFITAKEGYDKISSFTINFVKPYPVNTLSFQSCATDGLDTRESSYIESIDLGNGIIITGVANQLYQYLYYDNYTDSTLVSSITYNLQRINLNNHNYYLPDTLYLSVRYTGSNIANEYYQAGYNAGMIDETRTDEAYMEGYNEGKEIGYQQGKEDWKQYGYSSGYGDGKRDGMSIASEGVYEAGYAAGRAQVPATSNTNGKSLIWTIATTPFETFKTIWNVDLLGVNIGAFFTAIITLGLGLFILKKFIL